MEKEKVKSRKFNIIIYLLVLVALFTMLIGTSYAYYIKKIKNGDQTKVIIKSTNMLLRFYDGNQINAVEIMPGWEDTYRFSVENYSPDTIGKYKIKFEIINPLIDKMENNFVYELNGTSTKNSNDRVVIKKETIIPYTTTDIGVGTIDVGSLHEYELKLKLKENNQNQTYLAGRTFIAKIVVEYVYE